MNTRFSGKRILITGGLGFIGSNLARRLVGLNAEVTIIDGLKPEYGGNLFNIDGLEPHVTVCIGDLRDTQLMSQLIGRQEYLFNLAGQTSHLDSMTDPYTDLDTNAAAQLALLESCRRLNLGIRIVHASTRQVYGKPDYLPVDERHAIRPIDVNGANKFAGESYHLIYHRAYGIRATVLRLTNTYGPRMRVKDARQTFLGIWIHRVLRGEPILVYGDGEQLRDFNYVDDVVEALLLAAAHENAVGRVYNLGADEVWSLKEVATLMAGMTAAGQVERVPFPAGALAIDIGDYRGDYGLIHRELGWRPKVRLAAGLRRSLEYYRRFGEHYK